MNKKGTVRKSVNYLKKYQKAPESKTNISRDAMNSSRRMNSAERANNITDHSKVHNNSFNVGIITMSGRNIKSMGFIKPEVRAQGSKLQQLSVLNKMLKPSKTSTSAQPKQPQTSNPESLLLSEQLTDEQDKLGFYQVYYYKKKGIDYKNRTLNKRKKSVGGEDKKIIKESAQRVSIQDKEHIIKSKIPVRKTVRQIFGIGSSQVHPIAEEPAEEEASELEKTDHLENESQKQIVKINQPDPNNKTQVLESAIMKEDIILYKDEEAQISTSQTIQFHNNEPQKEVEPDFIDIIPLEQVSNEELDLQLFNYEGINHPQLKFEYTYQKRQNLKESQQNQQLGLEVSVLDNKIKSGDVPSDEGEQKEQPQAEPTREQKGFLKHQEVPDDQIKQSIAEPLALYPDIPQQYSLDFDPGQFHSFIIDDHGNLIQRIQVQIKDYGYCQMMSVYGEGQREYIESNMSEFEHN